MKLKLVFSYVGTYYYGWQVQAWKTRKALPTVQGSIEKAFFEVLGTPVHVQGAGRTDTGVHAEAQTAHCVVPFEPKKMNWQMALNNSLPKDIRVLRVEEADMNFHAQFDATSKIYSYSLWTDRSYVSPRLYPFVWTCGSVDFDKVRKAIPYLLGEHDFASFQNKGADTVNTVRTLQEIRLERKSESEYALIFQGNGFLKQMVRNLVGLLVTIGQGRMQVENILDVFDACDRKQHFMTAPAQGLTLTKVLYGDDDA